MKQSLKFSTFTLIQSQVPLLLERSSEQCPCSGSRNMRRMLCAVVVIILKNTQVKILIKKTLKTAPQLTTQNKRYNISSLRKLLTWRNATTGFTEKWLLRSGFTVCILVTLVILSDLPKRLRCQSLEQQTDDALLNCSACLGLKVSTSRFRRHYHLDDIIL